MPFPKNYRDSQAHDDERANQQRGVGCRRLEKERRANVDSFADIADRALQVRADRVTQLSRRAERGGHERGNERERSCEDERLRQCASPTTSAAKKNSRRRKSEQHERDRERLKLGQARAAETEARDHAGRDSPPLWHCFPREVNARGQRGGGQKDRNDLARKMEEIPILGQSEQEHWRKNGEARDAAATHPFQREIKSGHGGGEQTNGEKSRREKIDPRAEERREGEGVGGQRSARGSIKPAPGNPILCYFQRSGNPEAFVGIERVLPKETRPAPGEKSESRRGQIRAI